MSFHLPSFPYPPAGEGYWGTRTSTINWCEEDYYATIYSAEIINTSTNLIFIYLAYKGISSCIRYRHPQVFLIGFIGYLSIGIGSMCFHSSLKYPMQLLDELAMIYTTCIMVYALFSHRQSTLVCTALFLSLLSLAGFITAYYHYLQDPKFHQDMFALLTALVTFRSMWLMEFCLRPSRRSKNHHATAVSDAEQARMDHRDKEILKTMWSMYGYGLSFFGIGFCIWKMDTVFCGKLRGWRREVGLPWGILLEGHGWWHIFTGFAGYFNLTRLIWLRYCLEGRQDEFQLVWPSVFRSVPVVVRVEDQKKKFT